MYTCITKTSYLVRFKIDWTCLLVVYIIDVVFISCVVLLSVAGSVSEKHALLFIIPVAIVIVANLIVFTLVLYNCLFCHIFIPPANCVCVCVCGGGGILLSVRLSVRASVRPSVTFWFFFNILKRQWWKFIKFCSLIDIDKMYVYNRKLRAGGQFRWSYCPL